MIFYSDLINIIELQTYTLWRFVYCRLAALIS